MIAQVTGTTPGEFVWTGGDCHIYSNHVDQVKEQLQREPKPLPTMYISPGITNIDEFTYGDFVLEGYDSWPAIKAPVAV